MAVYGYGTHGLRFSLTLRRRLHTNVNTFLRDPVEEALRAENILVHPVLAPESKLFVTSTGGNNCNYWHSSEPSGAPPTLNQSDGGAAAQWPLTLPVPLFLHSVMHTDMLTFF